MAQNYKVFIDGFGLTFESILGNQKCISETAHFESVKALQAVENIFKISKDLKICTTSPKREFKRFKKNFVFIKAAGGMVEFEDKFLFIKRLGKWDLPKGKIDAGETPKRAALREIQEECNILGHRIRRKLCKTYHTYNWNEQHILKKTFWYHLTVPSLDLDALQPQLEEGITELRWFGINEFAEVRQNTFASIHVVLDTFINQPSLD